MKLIYHRLAVRDVRQILDHYDIEVGGHLADRFFKDLLETVSKAMINPRHFPLVAPNMRRANLTNFPYHVLYEERPWGNKIMVVRHHRRSPRNGMRRQ